MKTLMVYSLCLTMAAPAVWSADIPPLRGYSSEAARTEREWETKFRAIPDPAALRAYMQRLSARPHHVGSAYDALPDHGSAGGVERRYPSLARILVRGGAHRARVGDEVPRYSGPRRLGRVHAAPLRAAPSCGLGLR